MTKTKKTIKKMVAMLLAFAMVISVLSIFTADEVQAAVLSFKGKGSSTVTLTGCKIDKPQYIKFKAGVTGTVTITLDSVSGKPRPSDGTSYGYGIGGKLQLLNSKKKPLASMEAWWFDGGDICRVRTYGVAKGKTYYFLVQTEGDVQVKATVKTVKKYNNTSKKKAKAIKKGKTVTGVLIAGEKKSYWYKVDVKKSRSIRFTCKVKTGVVTNKGFIYGDQAKFAFTLYDKNGNIIKSKYNKYMTAYNREQLIAPWMPKGVCYIKVSPYTKDASGWYSITRMD